MYGETIRALREQKGMTQTQLAELLGVTQAAVVGMESGLVQFAGVEKLRRIAKALDVPIDALISPSSADLQPEPTL